MTERRINPNQLQNANERSDIKHLAGILSKLSYKGMKELAETFDATNDTTRTTADRLLAVAEKILAS